MFPAWELQAQMKYLDTRNQTLISNNFTAPRCIFAELKFVSHSTCIQIGHFASDIEKNYPHRALVKIFEQTFNLIVIERQLSKNIRANKLFDCNSDTTQMQSSDIGPTLGMESNMAG